MFPGTNLPLNIFEERYVDMINYSLRKDRYVGMIQQKQSNELYDIGCYGKITVFNETADKRYLINLEGINCFKIIQEVETSYKFRICEIEIFDSFNNDLNDNLKIKLLKIYNQYNEIKKINLSLDEISKLNIIDLLKLIVMVSPFDVSAKQMFLELKSNKDLYDNVLSMLEMELASNHQTSSIN